MRIKLLFLMLLVSMSSFADVPFVHLKVQDNEFKISPNPAKSELNINLPIVDEVRLEVFDVLGKLVYKGVITQLEFSVDVSRWKSGVYLVRISNDRIIQTKRFVKQ